MAADDMALFCVVHLSVTPAVSILLTRGIGGDAPLSAVCISLGLACRGLKVPLVCECDTLRLRWMSRTVGSSLTISIHDTYKVDVVNWMVTYRAVCIAH